MSPLIIANWKMNISFQETVIKVGYLKQQNYSSHLILALPTPYLSYFSKNYTDIEFCAQNVSTINGYGAYTGEFSAEMLKSCNVDYTILGHSEQRTFFKESNKSIYQKVINCINADIVPIICIGESAEDRKNNRYKEVILDQINNSIPKNANKMVIAYEPVWSIGTNITPTIQELKEIFLFIKEHYSTSSVAKNIYLVYGGSVNSRNYKEIMSISELSGVLIGKSSLNLSEMQSILY